MYAAEFFFNFRSIKPKLLSSVLTVYVYVRAGTFQSSVDSVFHFSRDSHLSYVSLGIYVRLLLPHAGSYYYTSFFFCSFLL